TRHGGSSSGCPVISRRSCEMSIAIEIAGVSKRFRMYREKPSSLKQRILSGRVRAEDFWALRDVSFDVAEGEFFALNGQNGSGKSTLLKVIAGILRPSEGVVRQRGRIAGLLELGAGFHPELTGRENVYLNAAFLGLSHRKTDAVYDDIVEFAELREFMDTAVKFYSSGMLVRLGFACAVHVDPEVILIDEVLAVGDEAFQARCLDRVRTFQKEGRTIVLVTHALDMARQLCDRAAMLDHGVILALGGVDGKRRVRFQLGPVPFTGGQYWVTVGVHSRDNQRVYHVQDQRYSFEVRQTEGRRDQTYVPVTAEVEDL